MKTNLFLNDRQISMRAVIVSLVFSAIFFATQAVVAQSKIPAGSYQQTCIFNKVEGTTLNAACATKGKTSQTLKTKLERYYLCTGDIWNNNGSLGCNKGLTPQYKAAQKSFNAAAPKVLGRNPKSNDEILSWLDFMHTDASVVMQSFYGNLMGENEAQYVLKKYLAVPENDNLRQEIINGAFKDVYNFGAKPSDFAFWNGGLLKADSGYATIVEAERKKLNADKVIRRMTIMAAYKKAMGRVPTEKEFNYWQSQTEIFKELVEAARKWLYTAKGAQDLSETVSRALEAKTGSKPSIEQINDAIGKYTKTKAIYEEM